MRTIIFFAVALCLSSCNTSIGLYRDAKQGVNWTKEKFQGTGGGGTADPYGAPTY